MDPENKNTDLEELRKRMTDDILNPDEMREGIKEDNGKEKEYWETIALTYMQKAGIPLKINSAKVEITEGPGMQMEITSQDVKNLCRIDNELLPKNLEEIVEIIVSTINTTGHNASQKMGGAGNVRILEICPPVPNQVID